MNDPYITLEVKEARVYADSFEDLQTFIQAIRMESAGQIAALEHAMDDKRDTIVRLTATADALRAEVTDFKETAVYGPQLHAEKTAAIEARDRALEDVEQLQQILAKERQSRGDLDRTRRAIVAENRKLTAERDGARDANVALAAEVERLTHLQAKRRKAKR